MIDKPFIHAERNVATSVRFSGDEVIVDLADGRALAMPLYFFPWLAAATESQRQAYDLFRLNIYWEELDEGIDLTAMLTGLYTRPKPAPKMERGAAIPASA